MSKMDSEKDGIVINRMYAGKYLASNIGHEAINLFTADNGNHYLYLNNYGNFNKVRKGRNNWMIMVKHHCNKIDEIVGLAVDLEDVYDPNIAPFNNPHVINKPILEDQKEKLKDVKYGGVSIFDIFGDAGQQSVFITFSAKNVYVPKKRLFIRYGEQSVESSEDTVCLKGYNQAKQPGKQYVYPEDKKVNGNNADYEELKHFICNDSLWEKSDEQVDTSSITKNSLIDASLFDICCIQDNENCFSNALAHFMDRKEYRKLWVEFFKRYSISLDENYIVEREVDASIKDDNYKKNHPGGGRIDLLIRDESNIIVIENKIKSGVIIKKGISQLKRYQNYIDCIIKDDSNNAENSAFFILSPNYNVQKLNKMDGKYKIINYGVLYEFLDNNKEAFKGDANFVAFFNAIRRHTFDNICDYLYHEMKNKFFKQIRDKQ